MLNTIAIPFNVFCVIMCGFAVMWFAAMADLEREQQQLEKEKREKEREERRVRREKEREELSEERLLIRTFGQVRDQLGGEFPPSLMRSGITIDGKYYDGDYVQNMERLLSEK